MFALGRLPPCDSWGAGAGGGVRVTGRARPLSAPKVPPICVAIAKAVLDADVTQEELAGRLGVSQSMVARWKIDREPSLDMVKAIERALGLARGELLRAAGYVGEARWPVARAVEADRRLDARARRVLLATYRALIRKGG